MSKSKLRKEHKEKVRLRKENHQKEIKKLKSQLSKMSEQNLTQQPLGFIYHKDKETVEVPIKLWNVLNQSAQKLQDIALFVSTMDLIGQQHIQDGTLRPFYESDLEDDLTGPKNPDGSYKKKPKDSFWNKPKFELEKPTLVTVDGQPLNSNDIGAVPSQILL